VQRVAGMSCGEVLGKSNFAWLPLEAAEINFTRAGGRGMKVREAIKLIEADGWFLVATRGSHRQYRHPTKAGRVTVAGKPSDDLAPGTLNSILKQAGLKEQR
jgi:predicted RNA binding protein YcfA (HicA-like mRNA interferase family)